jgi:diphthamide biosynthesis protein 3
MSIYEEVEIEDMVYDPVDYSYSYPCPCGDMFKIYLEELWDGEDIAKCPSCTLRIQVIFEQEDLPELPPDDDDAELAETLKAVVLTS